MTKTDDSTTNTNFPANRTPKKYQIKKLKHKIKSIIIENRENNNSTGLPSRAPPQPLNLSSTLASNITLEVLVWNRRSSPTAATPAEARFKAARSRRRKNDWEPLSGKTTHPNRRQAPASSSCALVPDKQLPGIWQAQPEVIRWIQKFYYLDDFLFRFSFSAFFNVWFSLFAVLSSILPFYRAFTIFLVIFDY